MAYTADRDGEVIVHITNTYGGYTPALVVNGVEVENKQLEPENERRKVGGQIEVNSFPCASEDNVGGNLKASS